MAHKVFLPLILMSSLSFGQQPVVRYGLGMSKPATHLFEVEVLLENVHDRTVDFRLPVWRPGRYLVLDFASGVQEFSAADGHASPLRWEKIDKATWRVEAGDAGAVRVKYKVYANEFNQRTRGLNGEHGFVDGTSVFMYVDQYRSLPVKLEISPPAGWHVTTGLEGSGTEFTAPSYDYFVDCPIEIGTQKDFEFSVDGVPHVLSITGEGNWESDTLVRDIGRIVKTQKDFFGRFPYRRYVFLLTCDPSGGGGTEHINSTVMGTRPFVFKNPDSYRGFLGLVSHEYFHTWNVKQFRPKGLSPYDYTRENYSRELWIAEGTTSYYDALLLVRAGLSSREKYLQDLAGVVERDRQRPGNAIQPLAEASFDAWVKYWRGTEQAFNAESDYYSKGASVSLLLDLEIRRRSANAASLDDVMRAMFKNFPLSGTGYTVDDFRRTAEECAGGSLEQFFNDFVFGTTPLPWETALDAAGLLLTPKDTVHRPWLGVTTNNAGDRLRVSGVVAGSPAETAGIEVGDELLALDGVRVRGADLNDRLGDYRQGSSVVVTAFHNDRLREYRVKLGSSSVPSYSLAPGGSPTDAQHAIYQSWLGGK